MEFHLILLLIVSVMLVILSAWNLSTFIRLEKTANDYSSSQDFEDSCHMSKTYTKSGRTVAIVMLTVSIVILATSCITIFIKSK